MKLAKINRNRYRREGAWIAAIGVFALLLIVMITVDTLRKTASIGELRDVARRTADIVSDLDQLTLNLSVAENAQRGFMLTRDEADHAAYQEAIGRLNGNLAALTTLTVPPRRGGARHEPRQRGCRQDAAAGHDRSQPRRR